MVRNNGTVKLMLYVFSKDCEGMAERLPALCSPGSSVEVECFRGAGIPALADWNDFNAGDRLVTAERVRVVVEGDIDHLAAIEHHVRGVEPTAFTSRRIAVQTDSPQYRVLIDKGYKHEGMSKPLDGYAVLYGNVGLMDLARVLVLSEQIETDNDHPKG